MLSVCLASLAFLSDPIQAVPRRVLGANPREVAAAQVGQGAFTPTSDGDAQEILVRVGERVVALTLDVEGLWIDVGADGGAVLELLESDLSEYPRVSLAPHGVDVDVMLYVSGDETRATVMTHYHLEADVEIHGEAIRLYFLDLDLNGRASVDDRWLALDSRQVASATLPGLLFASRYSHEPWYFGDEIALPRFDDQGAVELVFQAPSLPQHEFLAQRSARERVSSLEHFDKTRDSFFDQFELERGRAVDPSPPVWRHAVDLDEALAVARAAQRPLYVEFGNGGCPWCKRYDWLNYRDAEVTERLRRFTLVKIDRDIDPLQTARGLGLEGVPCHVLFDFDGRAVRKSEGWVPPRDYVGELDRAWADWLLSVAEK